MRTAESCYRRQVSGKKPTTEQTMSMSACMAAPGGPQWMADLSTRASESDKQGVSKDGGYAHESEHGSKSEDSPVTSRGEVSSKTSHTHRSRSRTSDGERSTSRGQTSKAPFRTGTSSTGSSKHRDSVQRTAARTPEQRRRQASSYGRPGQGPPRRELKKGETATSSQQLPPASTSSLAGRLGSRFSELGLRCWCEKHLPRLPEDAAAPITALLAHHTKQSTNGASYMLAEALRSQKLSVPDDWIGRIDGVDMEAVIACYHEAKERIPNFVRKASRRQRTLPPGQASLQENLTYLRTQPPQPEPEGEHSRVVWMAPTAGVDPQVEVPEKEPKLKDE